MRLWWSQVRHGDGKALGGFKAVKLKRDCFIPLYQQWAHAIAVKDDVILTQLCTPKFREQLRNEERHDDAARERHKEDQQTNQQPMPVFKFGQLVAATLRHVQEGRTYALSADEVVHFRQITVEFVSDQSVVHFTPTGWSSLLLAALTRRQVWEMLPGALKDRLNKQLDANMQRKSEYLVFELLVNPQGFIEQPRWMIAGRVSPSSVYFKA
jgi:hypothetical protein